MTYVPRMDRISQIKTADFADNEGQLLINAINGESETLWFLLRDKAPLKRDIGGKANLRKWCRKSGAASQKEILL